MACAAGRYGTVGGAATYDDGECEGPCDAGFFCPAGSSTKGDASRQCTAGYYCVEGSTSATGGTAVDPTSKPCDAGYFCTAGSVRRRARHLPPPLPSRRPARTPPTTPCLALAGIEDAERVQRGGVLLRRGVDR